MQLGATLFYKAQFDVESADERYDSLDTVIDDIRAWLRHKRYGFFAQKQVEEIRDGIEMKDSRGKTYLNLRSISCNKDGILEWAAILEERYPSTSSDIAGINIAARTWTTEFGYRQEPGLKSGSFSIILSYIDEPGFLGENNEPPKPTVPKIVTLVANDERLLCSKSGLDIEQMDAIVSVTGKPGTIAPDTFWGLVTKPQREYPIVLLCLDDSGQIAVDTDDIKTLYPNVLVCRPDSVQSQIVLRSSCPVRNLECMRSHALRIYAANPQLDLVHARRDLLRHRFFKWNQIEQLPNQGPNSLAAILRRALAEDVRDAELDGFTTYDEVENDVQEQQLRKQLDDSKAEMTGYRRRLEEQRAQSEQLRNEYSERLKKLEENNQDDTNNDILREQLAIEKQRREKAEKTSDEYLQTAVNVMDENDKLTQERYGLLAQIDTLRHRGKNRGLNRLNDDFPKIASEVFAAPMSGKMLESVVNVFAEHYSDRIVVTDRAYKSLRDCRTSPSLLWQAMWQVCGPLYDAWSSEESGNIDDRYPTMSGYISGFRAPLTEGTMTRQDNDLMRLRRLSYGDKEYSIEPHLAYGNKEDNNSVRIYYAWDGETQRIIIGHIGLHLTNYTTKKRS